MTDTGTPTGWQRIILIVLRVLFGLAFLFAGGSKLMGAPMMVHEFGLFEPYGLGQWFRYLTGGLEVVGALMLVRPRTASLGGALLTCVSIGAGVAQLVVLHGDVIHTIVFAAAVGWIAYAYRGAARRA